MHAMGDRRPCPQSHRNEHGICDVRLRRAVLPGFIRVQLDAIEGSKEVGDRLIKGSRESFLIIG